MPLGTLAPGEFNALLAASASSIAWQLCNHLLGRLRFDLYFLESSRSYRRVWAYVWHMSGLVDVAAFLHCVHIDPSPLQLAGSPEARGTRSALMLTLLLKHCILAGLGPDAAPARGFGRVQAKQKPPKQGKRRKARK